MSEFSVNHKRMIQSSHAKNQWNHRSLISHLKNNITSCNMNLENILLKTKCPSTIVNVFRQLLLKNISLLLTRNKSERSNNLNVCLGSNGYKIATKIFITNCAQIGKNDVIELYYQSQTKFKPTLTFGIANGTKIISKII